MTECYNTKLTSSFWEIITLQEETSGVPLDPSGFALWVSEDSLSFLLQG